MKKDNRGMTLVELIVAIAMSAVIMVAATFFLNNALRSYNAAAESIDLQMESQILMEQIATWVMEGSRVIVEDGGGALAVQYIPAEFSYDLGLTFTPPQKEETRRVFWKNGRKLYMEELAGPQAPDYEADARDENCIGEYIEDFSAVSEGADKVRVTIRMKAGTQEYELSSEIALRNEGK